MTKKELIIGDEYIMSLIKKGALDESNLKSLTNSLFAGVKNYNEIESLVFEYLVEEIVFDLNLFPQFPNLRHLTLNCSFKNFDFLENFSKLEYFTIGNTNEPPKKLNIDKPMTRLKEINFFCDYYVWKLFLKNYKLFPNVEICTFIGFEEFAEEYVAEEYLHTDDLLYFPKLKKIKLEDATFYEQTTRSLCNKHWLEEDEEYRPLKCMDKLSKLKYLEEIDYLLLKNIKNLKKFKNLKKITKFECLEPEENIEGWFEDISILDKILDKATIHLDIKDKSFFSID